MEPNCAAFGNNGCRDNAHPPVVPGHRPYFDIDGEASLLPDGIGAQPFHGRPGFGCIEPECLGPADLYSSRQSEDIVDPARPDQGIVAEVTFPAAGMVQVEVANIARLESVGHGRIEDVSELEMSRLLEKGPGAGHEGGCVTILPISLR